MVQYGRARWVGAAPRPTLAALVLAVVLSLAAVPLISPPSASGAHLPTKHPKKWRAPCDDLEAPVPGVGTDPDPAGFDIEDNGPISSIYPVDTSLDTWYGRAPCDWSIGGLVPGAAVKSSVEKALQQLGIPGSGAGLAKSLGAIATKIAALPGQNSLGFQTAGRVCGNRNPASPPGVCYQPVSPRPLNPALPFGGRDIVYVHGFDPDAMVARLQNVQAAGTTWPANPDQFYNAGGYWKDQALAYWGRHVGRNLRGGNTTAATNRFLPVAWASTQRLSIGIHTVLSQIAAAMISGRGVINEADPNDTGAFCSSGCVIVSHSTGGPVADVAMAHAEETKTNATLRNVVGDLGFIPDHVRAHVALHPALSGSPLATPPVAAGAGLAAAGPVCKLAVSVVNSWGANAGGCGTLGAIKKSVLMDLVPEVTQLLWRPWISRTPVPTLTTASGHPTADPTGDVTPKRSFMKLLFSRGMDDGVLSGDSQCATPNPSRRWPSGYIAKRTAIDVALNGTVPGTPFARLVFDKGNPQRGIGFYLNQRIDRLLAPGSAKPPRSPYYTASVCVPALAPDGMVQPVDKAASLALWALFPKANPLRRRANHYSFLISTSDHYTGPTGPYQGVGPFDGLCYEETFGIGQACQASNLNNNEEVRTITDSFVYTSGLVSPAVKQLQVEEVRGKRPWWGPANWRKKRWVWKRVYHRAAGWETLTENDYVYRYVLR